MLVRLNVLLDDLLGEAGTAREAWVLGAREKPVPATGGGKGLLLHRFCAPGLWCIDI